MQRDIRHEEMRDNWIWLKDFVQRRWDLLDDNSIEQIDGNDERLLDRIQVAYGIHRDMAETQLEDFMDECREAFGDHLEQARSRRPATPVSPRPHT